MRLIAHAAQHRRSALAKVGQAGWKTFAQELLPPARLHRWVLAAYTSYLLAVERPAPPHTQPTTALGIHPFAKRADGRVVPWLHPALFVDLGWPLTTESLLERYRAPGHNTYVRRFERGIVLYNPESSPDVIPLGAKYVDPWSADGCHPVRMYSVPGQSGALLVIPSAVLGRQGQFAAVRREL